MELFFCDVEKNSVNQTAAELKKQTKNFGIKYGGHHSVAFANDKVNHKWPQSSSLYGRGVSHRVQEAI
jgi:hypothetical protein